MTDKLNDAAYHRDRALRELNAGLTASTGPAARAHLELSTLHQRRARELGADMPKPPFSI